MPTHLPICLSSILLLSLLSHATDYTDPVITLCPDGGDGSQYTRGSVFQENLKIVLDSLSANTPASGFNNTAIETGEDRVYGRALCRGDVNSTICKNCIQKAGEDIFENCRNKDAMIWYEHCQIEYSLANFFSQMVYTGQYPRQNNFKKNISDPSGFRERLKYLMSIISQDAVRTSSENMFSTGEIQFSRKTMIYGLVQCTRDISPSSCETCLGSAMAELHVCCSNREGGAIFSRTCNVRFEVFQFYDASLIIFPSSDNGWKVQISVSVLCTSALILLAVVIGVLIVRHRQKINAKKEEETNRKTMLQNLGAPQGVTITDKGEFVHSEELIFMDLNVVKSATDNFSEWNKLGQGGFGSVYKGMLADGKEIAVKRLSRKSWQGLVEFKNEIILIARLQHKNLVKLIGCAMSGDEKLLIYEFMPNNSLDTYIFDSERRSKLGWRKCFEIIIGIARGLLYLHQDSRLTIIHRDLKPSNVLLDREMAAKISDFGMARIFCENENTANTKRVVGSFGYMAPEYAMEGVFSVKSDVYSFGVVLLEIVSGRRNNGFHQNELAQSLAAHAWWLWSNGKEAELVEPWLLETNSAQQAVRCIQIGLLCVQEDPADRPTMASVMVFLGSESTTALPWPKQPAFSVSRIRRSSSSTNCSVNDISLSLVSPR